MIYCDLHFCESFPFSSNSKEATNSREEEIGDYLSAVCDAIIHLLKPGGNFFFHIPCKLVSHLCDGDEGLLFSKKATDAGIVVDSSLTYFILAQESIR